MHHPTISTDQPTIEVYLELLAEHQSLLRSLADMTGTARHWCNEAGRRHKHMRRLMILAGIGWAAFVIMLLARWH